MTSKTLIFGATVLIAACAPAITKTPVSGTPSATARLVGEWHGDYHSVESGRHGTIAFLLKAGADTAEGDVIMEPAGESDPSTPNAPASWDALRATHQPLSIRFVFVSNDEVTGALNPYRDPNCGCTLSTTFRGRLRGDVIEGTFRSEGDGFHHLPQSGRWRVKRSTR